VRRAGSCSDAGLSATLRPYLTAARLPRRRRRRCGQISVRPMRAALTGLVEGRLAITARSPDESVAAGDDVI